MSTKPTTPSRRRRATTSTTRVKDAWDTRFPDDASAFDQCLRDMQPRVDEPGFVKAALDQRVADLQAKNAWASEQIDKLVAKARRQAATIRGLRKLANELGAQLP